MTEVDWNNRSRCDMQRQLAPKIVAKHMGLQDLDARNYKQAWWWCGARDPMHLSARQIVAAGKR